MYQPDIQQAAPLLTRVSEDKPRSTCCTVVCLSILWTLVILIATGSTTYLFTSHFFLKSVVLEPALCSCDGNHTITPGIVYFSQRDWSFPGFHSVFNYALVFDQPSPGLPGWDMQATSGLLSFPFSICDEVTGFRASGPDNCTANQLLWDASTCTIRGFKLSACSAGIKANSTDLDLKELVFNSTDGTIAANFDSHTPGLAGEFPPFKPIPLSKLPFTCKPGSPN